MSYAVTTDITCDGIRPDGRQCTDWFSGLTLDKDRRLKQEARAIASGWTQAWRKAKRTHLCPRCAGEQTTDKTVAGGRDGD